VSPAAGRNSGGVSTQVYERRVRADVEPVLESNSEGRLPSYPAPPRHPCDLSVRGDGSSPGDEPPTSIVSRSRGGNLNAGYVRLRLGPTTASSCAHRRTRHLRTDSGHRRAPRRGHRPPTPAHSEPWSSARATPRIRCQRAGGDLEGNTRTSTCTGMTRSYGIFPPPSPIRRAERLALG